MTTLIKRILLNLRSGSQLWYVENESKIYNEVLRNVYYCWKKSMWKRDVYISVLPTYLLGDLMIQYFVLILSCSCMQLGKLLSPKSCTLLLRIGFCSRLTPKCSCFNCSCHCLNLVSEALLSADVLQL